MDDQELAASRVGTVLHGKWKLEKLLGVGGMAAVYEATHRIGRRDAIKILHASVARSAELRARFEQEAHAVNRFSHPGAVEIRDVDTTEDGAPFLVMELLEGEPLSQRVGGAQGLSLAELLRLLDELLDVLAAAHSQGIIHRDIKPDNLFVLSDGRLKVLDFGIARMREGSGKSHRTLVGTRLGTLPYMPPEQIRGQPIDARADLFAVGAMTFRLLAGRRVHEAQTEAELASKMLSEPAPSLASVAPSLPTPLAMVVDRALAFDRERRYPDAAAMQQDVRALLRGEPPPVATRLLELYGPPHARAQTVVTEPTGSLAAVLASPAVGFEPTMDAPPDPGHAQPAAPSASPVPGSLGELPTRLDGPTRPAVPPVMTSVTAASPPTQRSAGMPGPDPTAVASRSAVARPGSTVVLASDPEPEPPPPAALAPAPTPSPGATATLAAGGPGAGFAEPAPGLGAASLPASVPPAVPTQAPSMSTAPGFVPLAADDARRRKQLVIMLVAGVGSLVMLLVAGAVVYSSCGKHDDGSDESSSAANTASAESGTVAPQPAPSASPGGAREPGTSRSPATKPTGTGTKTMIVPTGTTAVAPPATTPAPITTPSKTSPSTGSAPTTEPPASKGKGKGSDKDKDKDKGKGKG